MAAFAKISYNKASETYSETYIGPDVGHSLHGMGLGVGFKYIVNDNIFVKGEFEHVKYAKVSYYSDISGYSADAQTTVTTSTVTLGYKF